MIGEPRLTQVPPGLTCRFTNTSDNMEPRAYPRMHHAPREIGSPARMRARWGAARWAGVQAVHTKLIAHKEGYSPSGLDTRIRSNMLTSISNSWWSCLYASVSFWACRCRRESCSSRRRPSRGLERDESSEAEVESVEEDEEDGFDTSAMGGERTGLWSWSSVVVVWEEARGAGGCFFKGMVCGWSVVTRTERCQ